MEGNTVGCRPDMLDPLTPFPGGHRQSLKQMQMSCLKLPRAREKPEGSTQVGEMMPLSQFHSCTWGMCI